MSAQVWITLGIVAGAIALFASEKVRIDIGALILLVLLALLGIVTPAEARAAFSKEATVTVAAIFALSLGIERSGALEPIRGSLQIHRLHEDRHSADRAILRAVDVADPAILAARMTA